MCYNIYEHITYYQFLLLLLFDLRYDTKTSASTYSDDSWYVNSSHEVTDLAAYCRYVKTTKDGLHLASTRQNTCGLLVLQLHHHSPRSWRDTLEGRTHVTKLTSAHSRSSEPMPIYTFISNHGPTMHRFRN